MYFRYRQNIGAAIVRLSDCEEGHFCRKCARRLFWKPTFVSLFFGWWELTALVFNIPVLAGNLVNYARTFTLEPVPFDAIRPRRDAAVRAKIAPHFQAISELLIEGNPLEDVCRQIASQVGVTPGQALCAVRALLRNPPSVVGTQSPTTGGPPAGETGA
jgi:hypothetical protein